MCFYRGGGRFYLSLPPVLYDTIFNYVMVYCFFLKISALFTAQWNGSVDKSHLSNERNCCLSDLFAEAGIVRLLKKENLRKLSLP